MEWMKGLHFDDEVLGRMGSSHDALNYTVHSALFYSPGVHYKGTSGLSSDSQRIYYIHVCFCNCLINGY